MSRRDDLTRLRHMHGAAGEALTFVAGKGRGGLDQDRMLTLALLKFVEIIGEAASKISQALRDSWPEVPWADIIGMRHRLMHSYSEVNLEILWEAVTGDLPSLIDALEIMVEPTSWETGMQTQQQ